MASQRPEAGDERDTDFELPDSHFSRDKPGFKQAVKRRQVEPDHDVFPRVTARKDVPDVPLAERIRTRR